MISVCVSRCGDVSVFPQDSFYPVNWRSWHWLFKVQWISRRWSADLGYQAEHAEEALTRLNHSYIAHLWGSHSRGQEI